MGIESEYNFYPWNRSYASTFKGKVWAAFPDEVHKFKVLAKPLAVAPLGLIISKEYPGAKKLMDRFNAALERCLGKELITIEKCN